MRLNSVSNSDMARCSISASRCTPISATTEPMGLTFEDSSAPCLSIDCDEDCNEDCDEDCSDGCGTLPKGAASRLPPSEISLVPGANSTSWIFPATAPSTESVP